METDRNNSPQECTDPWLHPVIDLSGQRRYDGEGFVSKIEKLKEALIELGMMAPPDSCSVGRNEICEALEFLGWLANDVSYTYSTRARQTAGTTEIQ